MGNWWSLRPNYRNSDDVTMCFNMNIEYEAVAKEPADSIKASDGASDKEPWGKASPAVPTQTGAIRKKPSA